MRYVTSGESHGRVLTAIVTGVPAGIALSQDLIDADLARRQVGYGRGGRMRIESDRGIILSGVRFGRTIGTPVTISVANRDWDNWVDVMSPGAAPTGAGRVTQPRPGHADLAGILKTDSSDVRDVLERASARETAARVAAGSVARAFLLSVGVTVRSYVTSIGTVALQPLPDPTQVDQHTVETSDVRCPDSDTTNRMHDEIDQAVAAGESLGGTFVVVAEGLLPGLGGYAEACLRLDARLAAAIVSIPAIKGVEFGDGFELASRRGSAAHDAIHHAPERGIYRETNRAGGLEGGMTNGEPVVIRAAMKPIPTLMTPLASIDITTLESVDASRERSDVCAVPAAAVVAEAETALVLAQVHFEKFGADCVGDIKTAIDAYRTRIAK